MRLSIKNGSPFLWSNGVTKAPRCCQSLWTQAVVGPDAVPFAVDELGLAEHAQVMGDGGLFEVKVGHDVAGADFLGMGREEANDAHARGIGQRMEDSRQPRGGIDSHLRPYVCIAAAALPFGASYGNQAAGWLSACNCVFFAHVEPPSAESITNI